MGSPSSSNVFTASMFPDRTAQFSAGPSSLSMASVAADHWISFSMALMWPNTAAMCNGVQVLLYAPSLTSVPCLKSSSMISTWPNAAV